MIRIGAFTLLCAMLSLTCACAAAPKNGTFQQTWDEDGKKPRIEGSYQDGKRSGHWRVFTPEGELVQEGDFENDEMVGEWRTNADLRRKNWNLKAFRPSTTVYLDVRGAPFGSYSGLNAAYYFGRWMRLGAGVGGGPPERGLLVAGAHATFVMRDRVLSPLVALEYSHFFRTGGSDVKPYNLTTSNVAAIELGGEFCATGGDFGLVLGLGFNTALAYASRTGVFARVGFQL